MREKSFDSINVVPFIDIMLVLLTIVLATATFIKIGAIPVELPKVSETKNYGENAETVFIDISPKGVFYYSSEPVEQERLKNLLEGLDKNTHIVVRADKAAQIQPFAELMGILNGLGFETVDLQTEREK